MSKQKGVKMARRTDEGTSAIVASNSQIRPLRIVIDVVKFKSITASENCHHRTCFQRIRPKLRKLPPSMRMRSKPMSMMRSNKISVMSEAMIAGLVLSKLISAQTVCSCDHLERSYSCQMSLVGSKQW